MREMRNVVISWLGLSAMLTLPSRAGASDWPQFNFDGQHTGNNPSETTIQKSNVATLHVRYHVRLPSIADGAPAFLQGVSTGQGVKDLLFLNTKDGHVLALDAATGATLWSKRPATGPNYTTSSPAVDPNRQFVYAYALDGKVHKYMVADGTELGGAWPELATLKPNVEKGSSALSLVTTVGGTSFLYVAHGGYPGDAGDYQGHVTAINLATGAQNVFNTDCSNLSCHLEENGSGDCSQPQPDCSHVQSAVWARAGVVYSSDLDRIFFATGNGDYDANTGGRDWGDSVLAIHPDGTGSGAGLPVDSYTPTEFQILQNDDADLGSTSPAILPAVPGSNIAHLGVQSQKQPFTSPYTSAKIRLLDLSNLSGSGAPGHVGGEIQKIDVPQGGEVLTAPAVWVNPSDGSVWVFYANGNGISGLKIMVDGVGNPSIATQWTDGTGGTSPIVASGILYYASFSGMLALDPTTGGQLWSDGGTIGGIHWESPIVVNGRLYITDENAQLWAFEPNPQIGGDFNGDGKPDILWQHVSDGLLGVWYMNGVTRIGLALLNPSQVTDLNWRIVGVADFNADGKPDILWQNQAGGQLMVWYMDGVQRTGVAPLNPSEVTDLNWKIAATGDFNDDGKPDILWQNQASGQLMVWYMDGVQRTGLSPLNPSQVTDLNWKIVATGDFNADGKPDILWQNQANGLLGVWYMNGVTLTGVALLNPSQVTDVNWKIVATGDFNADGKPDILWQNQANGLLGVWYMNGVTLTGFAFLNPSQVTDPNWRIVGPR